MMSTSRCNEQILNRRIIATLAELGADTTIVARRGLPEFDDAQELEIVAVSRSGIEHKLIPAAARQWEKMQAAAKSMDMDLIVISAFRSFEHQLAVIEKRLCDGLTPDQVFSILAPPGCSEHHTGRALDIGTNGCEPASTEFAGTKAFSWLERHAVEFGFTLSYPIDNKFGFVYEPWHWCYSSAPER